MLASSSTMVKTPELSRRQHSSACLFVSARLLRLVMFLEAAVPVIMLTMSMMITSVFLGLFISSQS